LDYSSRDIIETDFPVICSWISSPSQLRLVSSDKGDCLTPEILSGWLVLAKGVIVLTDGQSNEPIGFCTLSHEEVHGLPDGFIECCHLTVAPALRGHGVVSKLMYCAAELAAEIGAKTLVGRVVPTNKDVLSKIGEGNWQQFAELPAWADGMFCWFYTDI